jgi:hypothetical protein
MPAVQAVYDGKEITELNKTDPLPPEFDEIMSQRLQFNETQTGIDIQ